MTSRQPLYLVVLVCAGLVLTFGLARQFRQRSVRALGVGIRIDEAVAFQFGRLIQERLPSNGLVLVVQLPAANAGASARARRQLAAFARGLDAPDNAVVIVSPPHLPDAALMDLVERANSGQWSKELLAWIAPYPRSRAVVSFMGFPVDLTADLPQPWPPVLAVYAGRNDPAADWIENGTAFALAELRPDADLKRSPDPDASADDIFNERYTLVLAP